jgi:DNA-binding transcriptional ArsR family regulator
VPDTALTASRLTDPVALRAYAHPIRLRLIALLRERGPQTATQAAAAIGESVPSCSFHLRQMAKYGLVEPAAGGRGRAKPWQAAAAATEWEGSGAGGPAADAALDLELALARQYFEAVTRWLTTQAGEPAEWREAAQFGDSLLNLTAAELSLLTEQIDALVRPFRHRSPGAGRTPADARPVLVLHVAVPTAPNPIGPEPR